MKKQKRILIFLFFTFVFLISCSTYKVADSQKRFLLNESGKNKYYLIEYIKAKQTEKILGEVPSLIIHNTNGNLIIRSDKEYFEKLNLKKRDIKQIEIISSEKATKLYGSAGQNGTVNIYTYGKPSNK